MKFIGKYETKKRKNILTGLAPAC